MANWWIYALVIGGVALAVVATIFVRRLLANIDRYRPYLPTLFYFGRWFLLSLGLLGVSVAVCGGFGVFGALSARWSLWYLLPLGLLALAIIATVCTGIGFGAPCYYIGKVWAHEDEITHRGHVVTYEGGPGTGKTLSMTYDGVMLAQHAYGELQYDWMWYTAKAQYDELDATEQRIYQCICDVMALYKDSNAVPLLYSNYPIRVGDKYSSRLTMGHLLAERRLPERAVCLDDESADELSNRRSVGADEYIETENKRLSKLFSKVRHYGNWHMLFAEQDGKENFVGLRRVTAVNRYLYGFSRVCQPARLIRRLARYRNKCLRRGICTQRLFARIKNLKARISKIGFFQISYFDIPTYGKPTHEEIRKGTYCLPINLPFQYDSRAYRFEYAALGLTLELDVYDGLYVDVATQPQTPEAAVRALCDRARVAYDALKVEEKLYQTAELRKKVAKLRKEYPAIYAEYCREQTKSG